MQTVGKILFYNPDEGVGIIMTERKEKFSFEIADWDDYDHLPERGMQVAFTPDDEYAAEITVCRSRGGASASGDETPSAGVPEEVPVLTSIRLNVTPEKAIEDYFEMIDRNIQERTQYKNASGRLDFLRMRRFLFTTYNNLTEMDVHFITPELKAMRDDLMQMSRVYDDYRSKATYPDVAFDKVFLSRQIDYVHLRQDTEYCLGELKRLHTAEQSYSEQVEEQEEVMGRTLRNTLQFERLEEDFKELKKNLVDTIHFIASLNERYKEAMRLMHDFEEEYREGFTERFNEASRKYRAQIIYILDAQSFMFDELLWRQAKKSKVVKHFFEEAQISGDYCSKTYLKYYLNTLDPELISAEQQELFELYEYLDSLEREKVMIMVGDIDDALRIKYVVARLDPTLTVGAFIDERKALAWALNERPTLIITEDRLASLTFRQFLDAYGKRVSFQPKIILLSDQGADAAGREPVEAVLPKRYSDTQMRQAVETLLQKDDNG